MLVTRTGRGAGKPCGKLERHLIALQAFTLLAVFSMLSGAATYRGKRGSGAYALSPFHAAGPKEECPILVGSKQLLDLRGCRLSLWKTFPLR